MRTILHLDMDQFYAAIEMRDRPELKGKPVIVGADPKGGKGRGVVCTANYAARKFGVRSALPISTAFKLCPQGVFLPVDMDKYCRVSDQIHRVFCRFTPMVETLSLDEAFLDVTQSRLLFGDGVRIACRLKEEIRQETALGCSVGVAANKFIAKIASDLNKPDGLTVVPAGTEREFLKPLPLSRLWGVGPKSEAALADMGLKTIGDLQAYPPEPLRRRLGNWAGDLKQLAEGGDFREVEAGHQAKSLGREITFEEDTHSTALIRVTLAELAEDVAARLRRHGLLAGQVTLKLRWEGFETITRQKALHPASSHGPELFKMAWDLFQAAGMKSARKIRLVGATAGALKSKEEISQMDLLSGTAKKEGLDDAMDALNRRFGSGTVTHASLIADRRSPRPKGARP